MLVAALLSLALTAPAQAAPPPDLRVYWSSLNVFRLGPTGLESQNRVMMQKRLMDSDSVLFENTFLSGGVGLKLNPAYVKAGPVLELQPIALFNLRVSYEFVSYFGSFGYLQSWPEPTSAYSFELSERDRNQLDGLNYVTSGHHLLIEPTVQAKASVFAVRSKTAIEYWDVTLHDDELVFYDATLHTLVPGKGWTFANDSDLLFVGKHHLTAGVRYSGVFPQYAANDFQSGEVSASAIDGSVHKVGPLLAWSFHTREYQPKGLSKPTLLLVGGWYLKHPNPVESTFPYILVGFGFTRELLGESSSG